MRRREKVDLQRTISPGAARGYAPRQGSKPRKRSGRQSQSRRAGTEVLGQQEVAPQTAAPGQDKGTAKAGEADTGSSGEKTVFTWETKQGRRDATVKSRGKSKTEYNRGTLCGSAETTLIQSNNTVNYRINHLEK